jgi:site-specific recombinase XerD
MKTIHYSFNLRTDSASVQKSIRLIICYKGKQHKILTGENCIPVSWDSKKQRVKQTDSYYLIKNQVLDHIESIVKEYINECIIKLSYFSIDNLKIKLAGGKTSDNFCEFMQQEYSNDATLSKETLRGYKSKYNKFLRHNSIATIAEVNTIEYVNSYIKFAKSLDNSEGTISKDLSVIKSFLERAVKREIIEKNVFRKIKIRSVEGHREYLEKDEILKLLELYRKSSLPKGLQNVLRIFLFNCFTGLRYTDLKDMKYSNLKGRQLEFKMHKTKREQIIPLADIALSLIDECFDKNAHLFEVPANQVFNRYIKAIMRIAGINKHISTHCARHTVATSLLTLL